MPVCCSVLQCVAVRCSGLQLLQCIDLDLNGLKGVEKFCRCVAVCCSELQNVAVCFCLLQCIVLWRNHLLLLHLSGL